MDLREIGLGVWIGFDWLRTETGGGLLWVRWWTFGFLRHGVSCRPAHALFQSVSRQNRALSAGQDFATAVSVHKECCNRNLLLPAISDWI
jgi:hypothetical protein